MFPILRKYPLFSAGMRSALVLLFMVPTVSCDQSLFDSRTDDAGNGSIDSGTVGIDADPNAPDASPTPRSCVDPCLADPITDFDTEQGGTTGNWKYLSNDRVHPMVADTDLVYGTYAGVPAWTDPAGTPAILNCFLHPNQGACAELDAGLVFVPGAVTGGSDPVLVFEVPTTGSYQLTGTIATAPVTAAGGANTVTISRNSSYDQLAIVKTSGTASTAMDLSIEAVEGDHIQVTLTQKLAGTPVAIDFRLLTAAVAFPGTCQLALTFDGTTPLTDHCKGETFTRDFDTQQTAMASVAGASVHANFGFAEQFVFGQNLESTYVLDYSTDFTIQYWLKRVSTDNTDSYGDVSIGNKGGMTFFLRTTANLYNFCYYYNDPGQGSPAGCVEFAVEDTDWHFLRISRTFTGPFEVCIDGVSKGTNTDGLGLGMSSGVSLNLAGSNATSAGLEGAMDDVRVFKQALPCALP